MCTVISQEEWGYPKTAEQGFVVYKECLYLTKDSVKSMFHNFLYIKDVLETTELTLTENTAFLSFDAKEDNYRDSLSAPIAIREGFHSLIDWTDAECRFKNPRSKKCICLFFIPEGALYYVNPVGNCVSNQIIFKEIL